MVRSLFIIMGMTLLLSLDMTAQNKKATTNEKDINLFTRRHDIGVNFTNVLGNLLSLNPDNENSPFGLTYRYHFGKNSFRMGLNGFNNTESSNESLGQEFIQRDIKTSLFSGRVGMEWHKYISRKFIFSYGIDVLYLRNSEVSNVTISGNNGEFNRSQSDEKSNGIGGGPIIRFDFKINDLFSISTESTLYFIQQQETDVLKSNNAPLINEKNVTESFKLVLPNALFVNIHF
jgi:hypothetical protein